MQIYMFLSIYKKPDFLLFEKTAIKAVNNARKKDVPLSA